LLNYSQRVWLVTSRLGTAKTRTFFYSVFVSPCGAYSGPEPPNQRGVSPHEKKNILQCASTSNPSYRLQKFILIFKSNQNHKKRMVILTLSVLAQNICNKYLIINKCTFDKIMYLC